MAVHQIIADPSKLYFYLSIFLVLGLVLGWAFRSIYFSFLLERRAAKLRAEAKKKEIQTATKFDINKKEVFLGPSPNFIDRSARLETKVAIQILIARAMEAEYWSKKL